MGLFIKKPFAALQAEANESGNKTLKRVLGPWSLIALGVGVIIGAGLFSITGTVAAGYTGPAITLSFAIAAIGCCFAGLCYAEFASMIPVAGSAYTYSYATMGELIAWIIGWDLVLEYTVAATTVSISWSRYLVVFLEGVGINIPHALAACPWDGGIVNIPAALIVVLMSIFLIRGTEGSSIFNGFIVFLKVAVILIFVVLGWKYINAENYVPYIPANTGTLGEFGFSGVLRGAAIVFFAFLGFDAVSTAAQETKNPKRDMPVGILGSLLICTILYMVFAYVMTGVAHYSDFAGQQGIAPVAVAIDHMGHADATGVIHPDYPWLNRAIVLAILFGYCSVIMVTLLGQSRVFLSMSRDGLLPSFFSKIHEKYRTPAHSNLLFMVIVGGLAAFVPARVAGEMTSIGTLFAFTLVAQGDSHMTIHLSSNGSKADRIMIPYNGYLYQDGMTVFTYGIVNAKISILNVMEKESWEEKDVELVAMHQSNQMIIKNVRMSLKSTPEKFPTNMKEYGNTGCSSIPLLLCDLYGDKQMSQPSRAILCAFGVGLTCGSIATNFSKTHFYAPVNKK